MIENREADMQHIAMTTQYCDLGKLTTQKRTHRCKSCFPDQRRRSSQAVNGEKLQGNQRGEQFAKRKYQEMVCVSYFVLFFFRIANTTFKLPCALYAEFEFGMSSEEKEHVLGSAGEGGKQTPIKSVHVPNPETHGH